MSPIHEGAVVSLLDIALVTDPPMPTAPASADATASVHAHRWSEVLTWWPPSFRQGATGAAPPVRYRTCSCGETVWGVKVDSPEVLAALEHPVRVVAA